jgi:hypothetical protein
VGVSFYSPEIPTKMKGLPPAMNRKDYRNAARAMYLRPMRKTAQRPHPAGIAATIDFLLSAKRDAAAAEESLGRGRTIPCRGHQYRRSTPLIHPPSLNSKPAVFWKRREKSIHRPVQCLNNVLEQDHRAIKRRMRASQHFRSFLGVGE